jgi:hypothetical protein
LHYKASKIFGIAKTMTETAKKNFIAINILPLLLALALLRLLPQAARPSFLGHH